MGGSGGVVMGFYDSLKCNNLSCNCADRLDRHFAQGLASVLLKAVGKVELEAHQPVLIPSVKQREHLASILLKSMCECTALSWHLS